MKMGNEDVDRIKYIEYQKHWPNFFHRRYPPGRKYLLEPWCDDCGGVGSVMEVMDENDDDIDEEFPWWIEMREGGLLNDVRLIFAYWTLEGWLMFMMGWMVVA